jgi:hypothetical protein
MIDQATTYRASRSSGWFLQLMLVLSLFLFSGFIDYPDTYQDKLIQTEFFQEVDLSNDQHSTFDQEMFISSFQPQSVPPRQVEFKALLAAYHQKTTIEWHWLKQKSLLIQLFPLFRAYPKTLPSNEDPLPNIRIG